MYDVIAKRVSLVAHNHGLDSIGDTSTIVHMSQTNLTPLLQSVYYVLERRVNTGGTIPNFSSGTMTNARMRLVTRLIMTAFTMQIVDCYNLQCVPIHDLFVREVKYSQLDFY